MISASGALELEGLGLTVLWHDVTAPELVGIGHVVKVVVPQMVPLSIRHDVRWLGTGALLAAAGLEKPRAADFNPIPHPLA